MDWLQRWTGMGFTQLRDWIRIWSTRVSREITWNANLILRHHPHRTHDLRSRSQDHHPSKNSVQKTIWCNSTSNAPDDGRMYPKHVELRIHQLNYLVASSWHFTLFHLCSSLWIGRYGSRLFYNLFLWLGDNVWKTAGCKRSLGENLSQPTASIVWSTWNTLTRNSGLPTVRSLIFRTLGSQIAAISFNMSGCKVRLLLSFSQLRCQSIRNW